LKNRRISHICGPLSCWLACMLFASSTSAAVSRCDTPTVGLANLSTNKALGDLLFDALTRCEAFRLVERDQMARILEEQSLSGTQDAVHLGKMVGADGLIVLNDEADMLHVRFVETDRGVRLFDLVTETGSASFDGVKDQVLAQIDRVMPKLRMEDSRRIYLGVLPFDTAGSTNTGIGSLDSLHTIVAIRLAAADNVLLVERDQLENVLEEQDLKQVEMDMLRSATHTIRGRIRPADGGKVRVEVQVRHGNDEPVVVEASGDPKDREALAIELADRILRVLGASAANLTGNLRQEADLYSRNGQNYLAHMNLLQAVRTLHVATLLSSTNEPCIRAFIEATTRQMADDAWQLVRQMSERSFAEGIPAKEYLRDLAWFEEAMNAALRLPPDGFRIVSQEQLAYWLLANVPKTLDDEDMIRVRQARAAFRRAMEWLCSYPSGSPDKFQMEYLATFFPYMFDDPASALTFLRSLSTRPGFPWETLYESEFHKIRYWNEDEAARLWLRYMDELLATGDPERQFASLASKCFTSGAFNGRSLSSTHAEGARKCARELFAWLYARPENLGWMLEKADSSILFRIWTTLYFLPVDELRPAFRNVMIPVVRKHKDQFQSCLRHLQEEYVKRGAEHMTATERNTLAGLLREVLDDPEVLDKASRAEIVTHHGSEPWFSALTGETNVPTRPLYPSFPGATLLFDSAETDAGSDPVFDVFGGVLDEKALWVAWPVGAGVRIARISIADGATDLFEVPSSPSGCQGGCDPMLLARVGSWLCIANSKIISLVPVQDHKPYLITKEAHVLGPVIAGIRLGYDEELRDTKSISMMADCGNSIYMAVDPGALLRWKPGMDDCEVVAASDALLPGPLNDCMPYTITAGCPVGNDTLCLIVSTPSATIQTKPLAGLWTYNSSSGNLELVREENFGKSRLFSRFIATNVFTFSAREKAWFLNVNDYSLRNVRGRVGDADGVHGWTLKWNISGQIHTVQLVRLAATKADKDVIACSVNRSDFYIKQVFPQRDVVYVLVACRRSNGMSPDPRGLVYRVPVNPEQSGVKTDAPGSAKRTTD